MPHDALTVHAEDEGVRLVIHDRVVDVDTRGHALRVTLPSGKPLDLPALRAGLRALLDVVAAQLGRTPARAQEDAIRAAVCESLRRSAARVGRRHAVVDRNVDAVRPTPLVHSLAFLSAPHLRDDAARFRPCQIAIAHVEDLFSSADPSPALARAIVDALGDWRALYRHPDATKNAVNKTLAEFGGRASSDALWGLRLVPMSRRIETLLRVEILGALGAHPHGARNLEQIRAVMRATEKDLREGCAVVESHARRLVPASVTTPHLLAEIMSAVEVDPLASLLEIVQSGIVAKERPPSLDRIDVTTTRPPIPLPNLPGVTFLATRDDIYREGYAMNHCVATRSEQAERGECYLFHVSDGVDEVTIQLDTRGRVVEARGPGNRHNPLVDRCVGWFSTWGRGFWFAQFRPETRMWMPVHRVPVGTVALETGRCVYDAYEALAARLSDHDGLVSDWFSTWAARAAAGKAWMVRRRAGGPPTVMVMNERDRIVAHSVELERARAERTLPWDSVPTAAF